MINKIKPQIEQKTNNKDAIIGGVVVGSAVKYFSDVPHKIISPKLIGKMVKISKELSEDEFKQVEIATKNALKASGLEDKGVEIIKATSKNMGGIEQYMARDLNKGLAKFLPFKFKKAIGKASASQIGAGLNCLYSVSSKKIFAPEKDLSLALFHEMGHTLNSNIGKIGKILQKCRNLSMLATPIAIIALCKAKKPEGEKPEGKLDKATTFIKENAGKLTVLTTLPILIEEALATSKGNKMAKELLSPELAKKAAKTNALGFSTYVLMVALSGVGIYLGTKVKDYIVEQNKQKA